MLPTRVLGLQASRPLFAESPVTALPSLFSLRDMPTMNGAVFVRLSHADALYLL